jgi:hypothetical protein
MARTRTLDELIAAVRTRTNLENSTFVSDTEITEYLNEEYAELVGRLTLNEGQPHYVSTETISISDADSLYALPADFWKVLRVTATIDGITRDMSPFMEGERADLQNTQYFSAAFSDGPRYRIVGDNIEVLPNTQSFTIELRYIRSCPFLVAGSDTVDGFNGYEAAMVSGACALVREKEETDPSFFERRKERLYRLIDAHAAQRDASHPERVTDVTGDLSMRDLVL